jgi:vacuolar protein sorting-associated protein 13A/C
MIGKEKLASNADLLDLEFEQNPLDGHADIAVKLVCVPLDIIVNKAFLERIGQFFVLPDEEMVISDLKNKAMESVNTLSAVTRAQLEDALQNHKSMDLNVNIQGRIFGNVTINLLAPTIIIPENANAEDSPLLVLDLGHLKIKSEVQKIDKSEEQKYNRKESDYYDHFEFSLTEVKMLLVPKNTANWQDPQVHPPPLPFSYFSQVQRSQNMQLIQDFDIRLRLENCIQPNEVSLTKMKLSGELPSFRVNFSAQKYGQIMKLVQVLTAPPPGAGKPVRKVTNPPQPGATTATAGPSGDRALNDLVKELEK